jgi:hypothetical protein
MVIRPAGQQQTPTAEWSMLLEFGWDGVDDSCHQRYGVGKCRAANADI